MLGKSKIARSLLFGIIGLWLTLAIAACSGPEATVPSASFESPVADISQSQNAKDASSAANPGVANSATIGEVIAQDDSFKLLDRALKTVSLEEMLNQSGPYTVFAPTDEAFVTLPPGTLEKLLRPDNVNKLRQVLAYHIVPGNLISTHIKPGAVDTIEGQWVKITSDAGTLSIGDAKAIRADIKASNGVVHAIDKVLLPPGLEL